MFLFRLPQQPVADLGHTLEIALAFLGLLFNLELLDFFFELARSGDEILFLLPLCLEGIGLFTNSSQFFFNDAKPFLRIRIAFFLERLLLDFELRGATFKLVNLGRHRINLNTERCGGLVDQINGFIRQETVRDVAM